MGTAAFTVLWATSPDPLQAAAKRHRGSARAAAQCSTYAVPHTGPLLHALCLLCPPWLFPRDLHSLSLRLLPVLPRLPKAPPPALHMGCCWPRGCHSTRRCFSVPCCSALLRCKTFCFGSWFYCSHPALCDKLACFPVTATWPQVVSTHLLLLKWVGKHPTPLHVVLLTESHIGAQSITQLFKKLLELSTHFPALVHPC